MRYSAIVAAASAFAVASAQIQNATFNTPIACCSVDSGRVPQAQRSDWCSAQQNTCVDLCGGQGNIGSNGNSCDGTSLQYTCKCSNGTTLGNDVMRNYEQTVPGQMCRFWYGACINATGENAAQQFQCQAARDSQCGNLTTKATKSSGASSGSTASATRSGAATGASGTSGASAAASSGAAALAQFATPALAAGLLGLFGMAL